MTKRFIVRSCLLALSAGGILFWGVANAQDNTAPAPTPLGIVTPAAIPDGQMPPQPAPVTTPDPNNPAATADAAPGGLTPADSEEINPNDIPSLLFTFWEHTALVDAKRMRGNTRAPTEDELTHDLKSRELQRVKPPPEEREIKLGGIVFANTKDWTIWLNGKRVTPTAIPKEVMDLKVHGEYIEMKWFDEYTNQIFPLRLRPHERFNIDTRIFLPG